jgi:hypothetical protein
MLNSLNLKLDIAALTLFGVLLGLVGTYLMTTAYNPFGSGGLMWNFCRVAWLMVTLRLKKARDMVRDTAFFGELNPENRGRSLAGIYLLFLSFVVQTLAAVLGICDVAHH